MLRSVSFLVVAVAVCGAPSGCRQESTAHAASKKVTLGLELTQFVKQGESDAVPVTVTRSRLDGPIDITFTNLPPGITITDPGGIPSRDTKRTYTLKASSTAMPVKDHLVCVTARCGEMSVTETFNLTVTSKT